MTKFAKIDEPTGGWTSSALGRLQARVAWRALTAKTTTTTTKSSSERPEARARKQRRKQLLIEPPEEPTKAGIELPVRNERVDISSGWQERAERTNGVINWPILSGQKSRGCPESIEEETSVAFKLSGQNNCWTANSDVMAAQLEQQQQLKSAKRKKEQQLHGRRKSELTTFLTILFGSSAVLLLVLVQAIALLSLADINVSTTVATLGNTTTSGQPVARLAGNSSFVALAPSNVKPESGDSEPEEDTLENSNETTEVRDELLGATKLGDLINEVAGSGADLLANRLRGSTKTESGENGANEPEEEEDLEASTESLLVSDEFKEEEATKETKLSEQEQQLKFALQTYQRWRSAGDDIIELFSRKLLPIIVEHGYDVDAATASGLIQVFNGIRALKPWAMKLLDASARLTPGLLLGTQSDFGDFDECLGVRVDDPNGLSEGNPELVEELDPDTGLRRSTLVGRYCLADLEFPKAPRELFKQQNNGSGGASILIEALRSKELAIGDKWAPIELRRPLLNFSQSASYKDTIFVETGNFLHMLYVDPIRLGVCLTNKIDPDAFAAVLNKLLEDFRISINFHGRCVTKYERPAWTTYQRVSAYVLLVACSLVVLSTALDLVGKQFEQFANGSKLQNSLVGKLASLAFKQSPLVTSFSLIRNTKRLFKAHSEIRQTRRGLQAVVAPTVATSCSVDSSPSIDRRLSSIDGGSSAELILNEAKFKSSPLVLRHLSSSVSSSSASTSSSVSLTSGSLDQQQQQQQQSQSQQCNNDAPNLQCLHGIRVITMTWMIVNHTYMFGGFFVLWAHRRLIDIAEWPKSLSFQLVLNGWLTVETYFFLSALIIVLNVLPLMNSRKFNYMAYVLHRLARLLPAYVGLVCLNFLWPLISSGPVWLVKGKSFVQTPCENYLWTNFLFVNNWIWPEKQCMVHTWFLSADFQLYLLAPMVVYLLYRRPVVGHSVNLLIAILASILSGLVIYANQLMPTTLINKLEFDAIKQQLSYSYFATYQHMGPYCLGILTGYVLHKRPRFRLPKHLTWLLWLLLPPLSFTTLLLTYLWNGAYDDPALINPSPLVSALYVAIHRTIWTSLIAWLVFACSTGRAKMLSNFLSHSMFIPISRLSYSVYLVHLPVIMFRALNLRQTVEWSDQNILWEACGNFIVSIAMGYFVNVTFESPIINLENLLFRRRSESTSASGILQKHNNLSQINCEAAFQHGLKPDLSNGKCPNGLDQLGSTQDNSWQERRSTVNRQSELSGEQANSSSDQDRNHSQLDMLVSRRQSLATVEANELDRSQERRLSVSQQQTNSCQLQPAVGNKKLRSHSGSLTLLANRSEQLGSKSEDTYNVSGEYRHYAPGSYQQWRLANGMGNAPKRAQRAQQYATLARTERLSGSTGLVRANNAVQPTMDNRSDLYLVGLDYKQRQMSRAQARRFGQDNSHRVEYAASETSVDTDWEAFRMSIGLQNGRRISATRPVPISRDQRRYNTLTGTGSAKEWRAQQHQAGVPIRMPSFRLVVRDTLNRDHRDPYFANWPKQFGANTGGPLDHQTIGAADNACGDNEQPSSTSDWLKSGAMIPRIDSTTLRRQTRRNEATATESIVEEPAAEDSSAL